MRQLKIFLAYPSSPTAVAEWMRRLRDELRAVGHDATSWEDSNDPGFIFGPIGDAIRAADVVLAETTSQNPNVVFEIGYALGAGVATYQLIDQNQVRPKTIPPLQPLREIRYSERQDVLDVLASEIDTSTTLYRTVGLDVAVSRASRETLYFVPTRNRSNLLTTTFRICGDSAFDARYVDPYDTDYDDLSAQAYSIAESAVFVGMLTSEITHNYWTSNAQVMLYAGIAAALEKQYVVVAPQPLNRLLDLEEHIMSVSAESDVEVSLPRWLNNTTNSLLKRPPEPKLIRTGSILQGLFLGNLDARAETGLDDYFFQTPEFEQAEKGQRHFFVGAKGAGKTANFEQLAKRFHGWRVILVSIAPADFEFPRLAAVFEEHLDIVRWEFVYGSFWRFILLTEILRVVREQLLDHLLSSPRAGHVKTLLDWFAANEAQLGRDFATRVEVTLDAISTVEGAGEKRERLEELLQIARMYDIEKALKVLSNEFEIRLCIDDLDRSWNATRESSVHLVIALLNVVQTLARSLSPNFKPAVFLRRDVQQSLIGLDKENAKRDPAYLAWDQASLELLIARRIAAQVDTAEVDSDKIWSLVFPTHTNAERTQDFIVQRTLLRPRDVILFCREAITRAQRAGRQKVSSEDVYAAWEPCGELLLAQIEKEYEGRYPQLGDVVLFFMERKNGMSWGVVQKELIRFSRRMKNPPAWVQQAANDRWLYLEALYESGIAGIRTQSEVWFEPSRTLADLRTAMGRDFDVVIHPAFSRYLRMT